MAEHFDAIIIGAGQAGPALANRLTKAGKTVAFIERGRFGGTCVNTGCMPTKTMVASAYAAHLVARAADYGVMIDGKVTTDMARVKARKDKVANTASSNVENWLKGMERCTIYRGSARLTGPQSAEVNGQSLKADMIFLDVGARAIVPSIPGIESIPFLTNETVMDLDHLPPHLIILGGSYIGLEFAQMYRRFGAKVTVIEAAPRLLPREDDDISQAIYEIIDAEGIALHLDFEMRRAFERGRDHHRAGRDQDRDDRNFGQPSSGRDRAQNEHRWPWLRGRGRIARRAWLYRGRRQAADKCPVDLCARRMQWARLLHPYGL